jgi:hypothetical protein
VTSSSLDLWIRGRSLALAAALFCALVAPPVLAEPSNAEALFKQGLEAMRAEQYESACPKLRESYQADPLPGVLFTLAECEAARGRSATSIELYQKFVTSLTSLDSERRDSFEERRKLAIDKITALSALAPEITVDVAGGAPDDLVVTRNGVLIEASAYGVGKKVDQGSYVVSAELDGKQVWERRFKVSERDRARIEVPWPLPTARAAAEEPVKEPVDPAPASDSSSASKGPPRKWMYVAGGVGIAGLATGLVAGVVALGKKGTIEDNCPDRQCNAEGREAVDAGQSAALVSSIGFAVGVAGAGATAALWLLSRPEPAKDDVSRKATSRRGFRPTIGLSQRGAAVGVIHSF